MVAACRDMPAPESGADAESATSNRFGLLTREHNHHKVPGNLTHR